MPSVQVLKVRDMKPLLIVLALVLTLAGLAAAAHTKLKSSQPANGSVLATAPRQLTLTFGERVQLVLVTVESAGFAQARLAPLPEGPVAEATVDLPALPAGVYTVNWRAAGADGHVMSGKFGFEIKPPATSAVAHD